MDGSFHELFSVCFSLPALTPLLTVDPVAQTGAQHLLAALGSDPALSEVEGGSRIDEAGSLGGGRLVQQGLS